MKDTPAHTADGGGDEPPKLNALRLHTEPCFKRGGAEGRFLSPLDGAIVDRQKDLESAKTPSTSGTDRCRTFVFIFQPDLDR